MKDSQKTGIQRTVKAIGLPALFAFLVALAVGAVSYVILGKDKPFLTFMALPADTVLDIALIQNGKTLALAPQDDNTIYLAQGNPQGSYVLMIAIKDRTSNQFKDITINHREGTGIVSMTADGFSQNDSIKLSGREPVHFDWSGKIEFFTSATNEESSVCAETTANISFCHVLPERTAGI